MRPGWPTITKATVIYHGIGELMLCSRVRQRVHKCLRDQERGREGPGLPAVLVLVPGPQARGRRFPLAFVLAVAATRTLAGAKTFREIGDQAADRAAHHPAAGRSGRRG